MSSWRTKDYEFDPYRLEATPVTAGEEGGKEGEALGLSTTEGTPETVVARTGSCSDAGGGTTERPSSSESATCIKETPVAAAVRGGKSKGRRKAGRKKRESILCQVRLFFCRPILHVFFFFL